MNFPSSYNIAIFSDPDSSGISSVKSRSLSFVVNFAPDAILFVANCSSHHPLHDDHEQKSQLVASLFDTRSYVKTNDTFLLGLTHWELFIKRLL